MGHSESLMNITTAFRLRHFKNDMVYEKPLKLDTVASLNKVRVLVIDDSAFSRRTIVRLLEEIPGVEVAGYAVNGEEGLRKAMDIRPDLITMDLEMPGMDGFTLLQNNNDSLPCAGYRCQLA